MEKRFTFEDIKKIAQICYEHRWRIGKDYFEGLFGFLRVLDLMKKKNISIKELPKYLSKEREKILDIDDEIEVAKRYPL